MLTYFISDIHVDFYVVQTNNELTLEPYFEKFYEENFLPADAISIAGDIANDSFTQIAFLKFISKKYSHVYCTFGNHDLVVKGATFGNGNQYSTSDERIDGVIKALAEYQNVHILEGSVVNEFGGCMGMCDFTYKPPIWTTRVPLLQVWSRQWFDGRHWHYKGQNPIEIWNYYDNMMSNIAAQKPKVMLTHFCPLQMGIQDEYINDTATAFFYFNGQKYLEMLPETTIWQCGHTHGTFDTIWTDTNGINHRIICNPLGYPDEPNQFHESLKNKKFLIEV